MLCKSTPRGKNIYYALTSPQALALMQVLYQQFCVLEKEWSMTIDWANFTPWASLAGGILLGVAAALFILVNGRVLGISTILGG